MSKRIEKEIEWGNITNISPTNITNKYSILNLKYSYKCQSFIQLQYNENELKQLPCM